MSKVSKQNRYQLEVALQEWAEVFVLASSAHDWFQSSILLKRVSIVWRVLPALKTQGFCFLVMYSNDSFRPLFQYLAEENAVWTDALWHHMLLSSM